MQPFSTFQPLTHEGVAFCIHVSHDYAHVSRSLDAAGSYRFLGVTRAACLARGLGLMPDGTPLHKRHVCTSPFCPLCVTLPLRWHAPRREAM